LTQVEGIETATLDAYHWIDELLYETEWEDRTRAFLALRVVLHTLRDRLTCEDAVSFAGGLPTLMRGVFFEGWDPNRQAGRVFTKREFLREVSARFARAGRFEDAESVTQAVFRVMARNLGASPAAASRVA
jgi:uncharacterized protein (DUF2267 family)